MRWKEMKSRGKRVKLIDSNCVPNSNLLSNRIDFRIKIRILVNLLMK